MPDYKILVPPPKRHRTALIVTLVVVVVVAVGAVAFVAGRHHSTADGSGGAGGGASDRTVAVKPLTVVSTVPASGSTNVPSDQVVTVRLSAKVTGAVRSSRLQPPGRRSLGAHRPETLSFQATAPFIPTDTETLVIPAGSAGPRSTGGAVLAARPRSPSPWPRRAPSGCSSCWPSSATCPFPSPPRPR